MKIKYTLTVCLFIIVCSVHLSCQRKNEMKNNQAQLTQIKKNEYQYVSRLKIFFGHQSVGFNIIDGIEAHCKEHPELTLNIKETVSLEDFSSAVFAHHRIGRNENPKSKIDDFKQYIQNGIGDSVDIVCMKLCYIDFNSKTDVENLFHYYKTAMKELVEKYPSIRIIHCTSPLETGNEGIKGLIKNVLGKKENILSNKKREKYNELIRNAYPEDVFDIARIESTHEDGTVAKSEGVACLIRDYTDDGGHLNETGRYIVADEFLRVLKKSRSGTQN